MRILFSLQVVPEVIQFTFNIPYAVIFTSVVTAFGTPESKNSWLSAQDKLLVDSNPLVFQLNF